MDEIDGEGGVVVSTGFDEQAATVATMAVTQTNLRVNLSISIPSGQHIERYRRSVALAIDSRNVGRRPKRGEQKPKDGLERETFVTPPESTSWQSLVRARMREEIDEWVAEGRNETQSDRPLVLIDVMGVISDATIRTDDEESSEEAGEDDETLEIPSHMPALVGHLAAMADVWWSTPLDDELSARLTTHLGVGPLPSVNADEYGMTEPAARELLWKAASAGRATYRIENVSSEIPSRLPDTTVLVNIAPDRVLRPEHLPVELRPA